MRDPEAKYKWLFTLGQDPVRLAAVRRGSRGAKRWIAVVLCAGSLGVLSAAPALAGGPLPLPPPPTLPPTTPPASVKPFLAVAGPTAGALCGTASLGILLTPSLAQNFFHLPFDSLIDPHTFTGYGNTALYLCGFVPFPLTPTECSADDEMLDALRGVNPLIAQVVGLYPEGATIDTLLAVEQLLPTGPSVLAPEVTALSSLMSCSRQSGAPPTPAMPRTTMPPATPARGLTPRGAAAPAPPPGDQGQGPTAAAVNATPIPAESSVGATGSPATAGSVAGIPSAFATKLLARRGIEWLALLVGALLLAYSLVAWFWGRGKPAEASA